MDLKEKMAMKIAEKMVTGIDKDYMLGEIRKEWIPLLPKEWEIDKETNSSWGRIEKSGRLKLFEKVGITKEDIREVLRGIKNGS